RANRKLCVAATGEWRLGGLAANRKLLVANRKLLVASRKLLAARHSLLAANRLVKR
ncbi:hypothetical protein HMPREF1579_01057, partial [Gardnerella vaginalis JCP8066]